jgi:hypothetical protein
LSVDSNGKANVNISNVLDGYASGSLKAIAYGVNEEGDHPVQIPVGNHGYNYTHTYGVMLAYNGASTQQVVGTSNGLPVQGTVTSQLQDGSGNAITSTVFGSARRLDVNLSSAGTVGSTAPTSANLYGGSDGTNLRAVSVDSSGRVNANINGTVPVSGTVTANTGLSQPLTDTQLRATAVPVSGTVTANTGLSQPLTDTQLRATAVPVSFTSSGTTGSTAPTNANLMGGTDGTNLRGLKTDSSGRVSAQIFDSSGTALTYASTGTAGTPSSDVISVQGITGGTPLPVRPRNAAVTVTAGTTSGTANTSAQALASSTTRQYLLIQNISDTDMYFNFGAAATTSNMLITKTGGGVVFETGFVPTDAVNVICSAASKSYYILSA